MEGYMARRDKGSNYFNEKRETMPQEKRRNYLDEKLREFVQHAHNHSKAAREKLDAAKIKPGEIKTIDDLQRLPITRKFDLVEMQKAELPFGGFEGVPPKEMRRIYVLPGLIYEPGEWEYMSFQGSFTNPENGSMGIRDGRRPCTPVVSDPGISP
jgi:phenylacetate-CoA ligase